MDDHTREGDESLDHSPKVTATPDLLGFIRQFVEAWEDGMGGDSALYNDAVAVIAKAEGRAPSSAEQNVDAAPRITSNGENIADYIRDRVCCPRVWGCELGGAEECPAERVRSEINALQSQVRKLTEERDEARQMVVLGAACVKAAEAQALALCEGLERATKGLKDIGFMAPNVTHGWAVETRAIAFRALDDLKALSLSVGEEQKQGLTVSRDHDHTASVKLKGGE